MKNSVTDDSPDTKLAEYKKPIWQMTDEIVRFADELNDEIRDRKFKLGK